MSNARHEGEQSNSRSPQQTECSALAPGKTKSQARGLGCCLVLLSAAFNMTEHNSESDHIDRKLLTMSGKKVICQLFRCGIYYTTATHAVEWSFLQRHRSNVLHEGTPHTQITKTINKTTWMTEYTWRVMFPIYWNGRRQSQFLLWFSEFPLQAFICRLTCRQIHQRNKTFHQYINCFSITILLLCLCTKLFISYFNDYIVFDTSLLYHFFKFTIWFLEFVSGHVLRSLPHLCLIYNYILYYVS